MRLTEKELEAIAEALQYIIERPTLAKDIKTTVCASGMVHPGKTNR